MSPRPMPENKSGNDDAYSEPTFTRFCARVTGELSNHNPNESKQIREMKIQPGSSPRPLTGRHVPQIKKVCAYFALPIALETVLLSSLLGAPDLHGYTFRQSFRQIF